MVEDRSKIVKFMEAEKRTVIYRAWREKKWGSYSQSVQSFSYASCVSPTILPYNIEPIVNDSVLYT